VYLSGSRTYSLTDLGRKLLGFMDTACGWTANNMPEIIGARHAHEHGIST
jgi:DNA-binding HxlR family transcriptional regulator